MIEDPEVVTLQDDRGVFPHRIARRELPANREHSRGGQEHPGAVRPGIVLRLQALEDDRRVVLRQGPEQRAPCKGEAMQHAPRWVYPAHNLALAYVQTGDYSDAIDTYKRAIELAPDFAYLPYNLGLVYQRLNRRKAAEKAYRQALAKAEKLEAGPRERYLAHSNNALGYLRASAGRRDEAEELYRAALTHSPDLIEARHNLAVLLADESGPARPDEVREAFDLLRANLSDDAEYLPSRISLARALARHGQTTEAIAEYEQVVQAQPEFMAARLALAELHTQAG